MEIREIIYVNTVAEFKNLTKAAESLHITQPSLSQSIKSIENRLNIQLFMRNKRGMELTPAGMRFIRDSANVMNEYNIFLSKLKHYSEESASHYLGLYKLSHTTPINDAIMSFISNNSKDNYIIKVESIDDLEKMLLSNQLDLAVIKYTPLIKRNPNLAYEVLFQEKLFVLVSKTNPLSSKEIISIDDLVGNKLITSAKNEYPYAMTNEILRQSGIDLEIHTYTNYYNLTMIMNLVENDLGITFATQDVCKYYSRPSISYIPLNQDYFYDICIVQNKIDANNQSNRVLIDYIHDFISENKKSQR